MMSFPDSFSTARLRAERVTDEHLDDLCQMDADPEFMALLGGVRGGAETTAYLVANLRHWTEYGFGLWILRDRHSHRLAGRAVLRHVFIDEVDDVEVGYGILPELWGHGLATEIAAECVRRGFEDLGLESVVALTLPEHVRSQRVLGKVGLAYERDVMHGGLRHALFRTRRLDRTAARLRS